MDYDNPIRFSAPSYDYEPEHGSYGCEPRVSTGFIKAAIDDDGGHYPTQNNNIRTKLREVQTANTWRLISIVFRYDNTEAVNTHLKKETRERLEKLKWQKVANTEASKRLKAAKSNLVYHMIREEVEHYNLGVNIRTMARISVIAQNASRDKKATLFRVASLELRNRAVKQIDHRITEVLNKYPDMAGRVLKWRLQQSKTHINVDPFHVLNENLYEPLYHKMEEPQKVQFWLNRFANNVLGWLWPYRGVIDIFATLAIENMSDYIKAEFVLVCRTMWEEIIASDVDRVGLQQAQSVAERGTDVYMLHQSDKDRYHAQIKSFHVDYNEAHPTKRVETLDEIRVSYNTIDTANGDSGPVADKYIFRVNAKVRAAEIAAVDVNAAY
jgi:hypothetical protein